LREGDIPLTHSDITAQLFLDIGYSYNYKSIDPKMRDEVLAEWKKDKHGRLSSSSTATFGS